MIFAEKVETWEVLLLLGCLLFLGLYAATHMDLENMLQKDSPVPVHMGGQAGKLPRNLAEVVKVEPIPEFVYQTLEKDDKYKRYLTGNHKYILFFTYPGCPYANAFTYSFKQLFQEKGYKEYYRKRIVKVGRTTYVSCPGMETCASLWVMQTCFGKLCILNPQRKQVVVFSSQQAAQLEPLLETYREW